MTLYQVIVQTKDTIADLSALEFSFGAIIIIIGLPTVIAICTFIAVKFFYSKRGRQFTNATHELEKMQTVVKEETAVVVALQNKIQELEPRCENLKSEHDCLKSSLANLEEETAIKKHIFEELDLKTKRLQFLQSNVEALTAKELDLKQEVEMGHQQVSEGSSVLSSLKSEIDIYSQLREYTQLGLFEDPQYIFETSDRYNEEIKRIREGQRNMIKADEAIIYPEGLVVPEDQKVTSAIIGGQKKLLLKTFNINCDFLIAKLKPSTVSRILEQIDKLATDLEKNCASLQCGFNTKYVELKYKEASMFYQYSLLKEQELEKQKLVREQLREEAKVRADCEKEQLRCEKEEKAVLTLLEKAKNELAKVGEVKRIETEQKIAILEQQLLEAQQGIIRAKSMAEQTKKGYVYIISNVGSFGADVYKIGLSRRLDPQERVNELGDASVPFKFDVHAMIYSDNAPLLEHTLHTKFRNNRVNVVNNRKEFFRVSLEDIKEGVAEIIDDDIDFRKDPQAPEYFETLRLLGAGGKQSLSSPMK
jgi:hypothetical protein